MNHAIGYRDDLAGVDWEALKRVLAEDRFDNGRTADQLRRSFENSARVCIAWCAGRVIGKARVLSDGVCNAYLLDVWTHTPHRRRGVGRELVRRLSAGLAGQHLYCFTDDIPEFYERIGFARRGVGLEKLVGKWLENPMSDAQR